MPISAGRWILAALTVAALAGPVAAQPRPPWGLLSPTPTPASTPASSPASSPADAPPPPLTPGQSVEVVFRDGRSSEGTFLGRTDSTVRVRIGGIVLDLTREQIVGVRGLAPVEERFEALRSATADDDVDGIMQLAEWIRSRGRLDLALVEVERVLAIQRGNTEAIQLRKVILEQARLDQLAKSRPPTPTPTPTPAVAPKPAAPESSQHAGGFPLLSADEVNTIRVYEIDLALPPKLVIKREAIDRFLSSYAGKPIPGRGNVPSTPEGRQGFLKQTPVQILGWFFDAQARELYADVQVRDDPHAMKLFRENVLRGWLLNRCATDRCHGGQAAGRLWLTNDKPATAEAAYTNFFILERFRLHDGRPVINYAEPAASPLLQMGLPKDKSRTPHPDIGGLERWDPPFRGEQDERFLRAVDWIRAMYPRRPEYPITYTPPAPTGARPAVPRGKPPAPGAGGPIAPPTAAEPPRSR